MRLYQQWKANAQGDPQWKSFVAYLHTNSNQTAVMLCSNAFLPGLLLGASPMRHQDFVAIGVGDLNLTAGHVFRVLKGGLEITQSLCSWIGNFQG
jgi:hypothetical protein